MSTPPSPSTKSARRASRDTGFPEPFCGNYNTTLPHPDADLSPNASISGDNLTMEPSMRRRRLSMLHKHRRTLSQNSTTSANSATSQALYSVLGVVAPQVPGTQHAIRPTSSNNESIDEEEISPDTVVKEDSETPRETIESSPRPKSGVFRGWRLHRG